MNNFFSVGLLAVCAWGTAWCQVLEETTRAVKVSVGAPVASAAPEPAPLPEKKITLEELGITSLPRYHALIIGVSKYQNVSAGLPNLDMPVHDAKQLSQLLVEKYAFDKKDVHVLTNATREEIINQFDHLAEAVGEKDNLLIFYAGHGYYDKGKDFGYWLPADAKLNSRSAWIANSTIKDYIGAIKGKHTLLITDACFGGSIFKSRSVSAMVKRLHESYRYPSRKALTSGNLSEVPDKSVFLKYLIKGLDENQDVFLTTPLLFSRIYETVLNNSTTAPQFGVVQGAGDEGGDFVFIRKN